MACSSMVFRVTRSIYCPLSRKLRLGIWPHRFARMVFYRRGLIGHDVGLGMCHLSRS
jgi:hypothetical protein